LAAPAWPFFFGCRAMVEQKQTAPKTAATTRTLSTGQVPADVRF
jgi:hypothetical protein